VTLADLDDDGFPDIVAANRGDYPDPVDGKPGKGPQNPTPSYVCFNDGKAHFPACQPLPKTESATSIVAADFDDDGAIDLFVPHRDGGQSYVLWNDGKGYFPTWTKVGPAEAWIRMGAAGDLNGDGRPDLATIDEAPKGEFYPPKSRWTPIRRSGPSPGPRSAAVLRGDCRPESGQGAGHHCGIC
jgi:hypothetical protein